MKVMLAAGMLCAGLALLTAGRSRKVRADRGAVHIGATEKWSPKAEYGERRLTRFARATRAELAARMLAAGTRRLAAQLERVERDALRRLDAAWRAFCRGLNLDADLYATLTVV